jgi:hypothetical protein
MSDEKTLIHQFLFEGGWYVTLISVGGATARILNSDERHSIWDFFRKIVVAAIVSGISWFVLEQANFSSFTKAVVYGVIGVVSPELIDGLITLAKKIARRPSMVLDIFIKK